MRLIRLYPVNDSGFQETYVNIRTGIPILQHFQKKGWEVVMQSNDMAWELRNQTGKVIVRAEFVYLNEISPDQIPRKSEV